LGLVTRGNRNEDGGKLALLIKNFNPKPIINKVRRPNYHHLEKNKRWIVKVLKRAVSMH
jgi:hypothetical protein